MNYYQRHDAIINDQQLLLNFIDLAKQRGLHPDKLLKGTKIFYQDLPKKFQPYSPQTLLTIIENCSKHVNAHDISFLLGRRYFPSHLGTLGQALMNCRHLADMLRVCQCFQVMIFPLMSIELKHFNNNTHIIFTSAVGALSARQEIFLSEFLLSSLLGAVKYRCQNFPELSIHLAYDEVNHIEQYQSHITSLNTKLYFQQKISMLSIATPLLYKPFNDSSSSLKAMALSQIKAQIKAQAKTQNDGQARISFMQTATQYITKQLMQQQALSLAHCAQHFGYSSATFKRKLADHNVSYQSLLDAVRGQQAIFQLIIYQHSNEEIATSLDFTDVSNFRKAFKRWTGMTPSNMRAQVC